MTLVAVMARRPAAVRHGQVGHTVGHHPPPELPADHVPRLHASAGQRHRRQELAVGKLRDLLARSAHADEVLDAVVVRLQLPVADGPVLTVSVAARRLELVVAEAVALARPAEGLAADLPAANPQELLALGKRVRVLVVVHEKLVAVLVAGVAEPLHRLVLDQLLLIAEAPVLELVRPDVLGEVARRHARRPGLQHQNAQPTLGRFLGHPSAARTRPDDEDIVRGSSLYRHYHAFLEREAMNRFRTRIGGTSWSAASGWAWVVERGALYRPGPAPRSAGAPQSCRLNANSVSPAGDEHLLVPVEQVRLRRVRTDADARVPQRVAGLRRRRPRGCRCRRPRRRSLPAVVSMPLPPAARARDTRAARRPSRCVDSRSPSGNVRSEPDAAPASARRAPSTPRGIGIVR